jgi:hypothetical protein
MQSRKLTYSVTLIIFAALAAQAQQSQDGILRINGGSMTISLSTNLGKIEHSPAHPASLATIYSDLGTGSKVYLSNIGWSITGPEVYGGQVDSATPFTPKRDFNLVLIKVAILNSAGTNGVTLTLNRDSNGQPGTAIRTWNLVNLPMFPGCCRLDLARLKKTVVVRKGIPYWLVGTTGKTTPDSNDSWNMNSRSLFGTVGQRFNKGSWEITKGSALLPAFSVLGTPAR